MLVSAPGGGAPLLPVASRRKGPSSPSCPSPTSGSGAPVGARRARSLVVSAAASPRRAPSPPQQHQRRRGPLAPSAALPAAAATAASSFFLLPTPMMAAFAAAAAGLAAYVWAWLDARAKTGPVEVVAPSAAESAADTARATWADFHAQALSRCASLRRDYTPAPFFTNPHSETILAAKLRAAPDIFYRREILRMASDGGAVALDWEHWDAPPEQRGVKSGSATGAGGAVANTEPVAYGHDAVAEAEARGAAASAQHRSHPAHHPGGPHDPLPDTSPLLVLFPGLTGGSGDPYVRHALASARARGIRAVVFNSRGTAGSPVLTPQFYSASFTQDAREVFSHVQKVYPRAEAVYAVGWSLGGNILLRYLAEEGDGAPVEAAVSLCNPFDLTLSNAHLKRGFFGRLYDANLASSLRRIFASHAAVWKEAADAGALPPGVDPSLVPAVRTIADFDACVTAPTFGWRSVPEYYARSSSSLSIPSIRVPLLCVQAEDDPIAPAHAIPRLALRENPRCALVVTRTGGHLGWVTAEEGVRGKPWTDELVVDWLSAVHELRAGERSKGGKDGGEEAGATATVAAAAAPVAAAAK